MAFEHTQPQTDEQQQVARELSLRQARPPAELPGYEIQAWLGSGAFGEVWIGIDRNTGRRVAIKFYLHRSALDWTRLASEVEKLVFLSADRYVVQLLEVGWNAEPPYYVMEYVENGSLADLLTEQGPLPPAVAVDLFRELAIGLMHAHGKGVLHCDLKPANILLDEDHKPRLADFGQSRMSHEQSPALGTLFYMAPEQADLEAVPDARWDVYALGAILYCLLTGSPPYHEVRAEEELLRQTGLVARLQRYREWILTAPLPVAHRRRPGVDRALAEIVDRCLARDPQRRFANVQAVLDALEARFAARRAGPLVLLGFVGPVLLLAIMGVFGLRGYERAVREAESLVVAAANEKNRMTAQFAASSIEGEIYRYFSLVEREASRPEFRQRFETASTLPLIAQLNSPNQTPTEIARLRPAFVADPARAPFDDYLKERLNFYLDQLESDAYQPKLASFLCVDRHGRMLANAYDHDEPSKSIGWNYAYRTYFHGGPADLEGLTPGRDPYQQASPPIAPIRQTHFSAAFRSTTTGLWKVGISTPIYADGGSGGEVVGVLAATINLGDFAYFRRNHHPDRFAVLIDGRRGPQHGVILQHPLFDTMGADGRGPDEQFVTTEFRVPDQQLQQLPEQPRYRDPLGQAPGGESYQDDWIASSAPVSLPQPSDQPSQLVVLVQERWRDTISPVQQLGERLKREGLWALGGVCLVTLVLWSIVLRMLQDPPPLEKGPNGSGKRPTST
jgi:hypothetical protein